MQALDIKQIFQKDKRIYFVGIAGISMSGMANLALDLGLKVGGSDPKSNHLTEELKARGAMIWQGHAASQIEAFEADMVCYSAAIPDSNPELSYARSKGLLCLERNEFLGALNLLHEEVINIAGTNGKTTTTALSSLLLLAGGVDPTIHIGAELPALNNATVRLGRSLNVMVSEACEFKRSFLAFFSTTAVVLNIAHDHVDCYPTLDDVLLAFAQFIGRQDVGERLVIPSFDANVARALEMVYTAKPELREGLEVLTFGLQNELYQGHEPTYAAAAVAYTAAGVDFDFYRRGEKLGRLHLAIPGRFNLDNALAALAVADLYGVGFATMAEVLANFHGAAGRFEHCGQYRGAELIADYAHHPDSVALTLEAARALQPKRLVAFFQPITYSRAQGLADGYVKALQLADLPCLCEVYDDREKDHSFSSAQIAAALRDEGRESLFFESPEAVQNYCLENLQEGDVALFMGSNIRDVPHRLGQEQVNSEA